MPAGRIFNQRRNTGPLRGLFSGIILAKTRANLLNYSLAMHCICLCIVRKKLNFSGFRQEAWCGGGNQKSFTAALGKV